MSLTDRAFWIRYWETKGNLVFDIKKKFLLYDELQKIVLKRKPKSAIELGGFPGYFAVYLKKWYNINSTLLDYVIHPEISKKIMQKNGITEDAIQFIESDLWKFDPEKRYDLVLSVGLIEHFEDTKDILLQHIKFLNEGGYLLINIPNFRGFNGWIQKKFDPENYNKHYIPCMDPRFLAETLRDLGLNNVKSYYYGGFSMWLENIHSKSFFFQFCFKLVWLVNKSISKLIPIDSRRFSPYINLVGTR